MNGGGGEMVAEYKCGLRRKVSDVLDGLISLFIYVTRCQGFWNYSGDPSRYNIIKAYFVKVSFLQRYRDFKLLILIPKCDLKR